VIEDASQGRTRPVIKLAHDETIADALSTLAEHNILAAPVRTTTNAPALRFCGASLCAVPRRPPGGVSRRREGEKR
jgi:CBS domain-containing protein